MFSNEDDQGVAERSAASFFFVTIDKKNWLYVGANGILYINRQQQIRICIAAAMKGKAAGVFEMRLV